jgi:hypothetical protein
MTTEPLERRDLLHDLEAGNGRCTARSKRSGQPCNNAAMLGGNVCRIHGGSAPQTRAKAQRRLAQAADVLVQRLLQFALDGKVADPVALQAIRDALDRAGLSPKQSVEVEVELKPWEQMMQDIVFERGVTRAEHNARRGLAMPVIDAEVVESPDTGASSHVRAQEREDHLDTPPTRPATPRRPRSAQLDSAEEAVAETTSANRRSTRRRRR